jgi:hypothetical protein
MSMDSGVVEAVRNLSGQLSDPVEFFGAVCGDVEEHKDSGFDAFRSAFASRGFGAAGDELIRYLDDNGRLELAAKIAEHRPEELAAAYQEQEAAGDEVASEQDGPEAEAAWQALLTEYSGYWDGDEENWAAFEQYVMYYATEQGVAGPAQRFFERAAAEDKLALFAEYGVEPRFGSADEDTDSDAENALWQTAIEQFGAAWAAWDGTDSGWAEYRDWFYDATNSQDPAMYALAYERLQPLDELAPEERVAPLRDLGFDVSGTEAQDVQEARADEPEDRMASLLEAIDDPAVEGVSREDIEELVKDPDFEQRMAAAEAEIDAALDDVLSGVEPN